MNIPYRYSHLGSRGRKLFGYWTFLLLFGSLGILFRPVWYVIIVINWIVVIGHVFGERLPYYIRLSSGDSMVPAIPTGLSALIVTDKYNSVEVGDAVSYRVEELDYDIFHRVVGSEGEMYTIKGDGNDSEDPYCIKEENIINKSVQYGMQPIFIPLSPLAVVGLITKFYRKLAGKERNVLNPEAKKESENN